MKPSLAHGHPEGLAALSDLVAQWVSGRGSRSSFTAVEGLPRLSGTRVPERRRSTPRTRNERDPAGVLADQVRVTSVGAERTACLW